MEDSRREILLRHARHPERTGSPIFADAKGECRNPICGDHVEVFLTFDRQRAVVDDVRIQVSGCGIATASASLMTSLVQGTDMGQLRSLQELAAATLSSNAGDIWPDSLKLLEPLESLRSNPRKIPCALMAWYALKAALSDDKRHPV